MAQAPKPKRVQTGAKRSAAAAPKRASGSRASATPGARTKLKAAPVAVKAVKATSATARKAAVKTAGKEPKANISPVGKAGAEPKTRAKGPAPKVTPARGAPRRDRDNVFEQ